MTGGRAAELRKLYAQVPHIECQQLCAASCGPAPCSREERRIIVKTTGRAPHPLPDLTCSLLRDGLCSAYVVRPMICRLWGVCEDMRCPHGCVPDRWLTYEEGSALIRASIEIGGRDDRVLKEALEIERQNIRRAIAGEEKRP